MLIDMTLKKKTMGKINRRRKSNNNDINMMRSSSSSATAVSILLISSSGPLSPPLLQGTHALGSAFSCGSSIREARSCSTLCSITTAGNEGGTINDNGTGGACPSGQKCYAGIECEPSKSMDWILDWQGRLERRMLGDSSKISSSLSASSSPSKQIVRLQQEQTHAFVCGRTYADVEARCKRAGSAVETSTSSSSFSDDDYHGVHYCPTGSSSECPASMECYYATVPCSILSTLQQQHQQSPPTLAVEKGDGLELLGLPPLVSPTSDILSRLDVDSITMALSSYNNNNNDTERVNSTSNTTDILTEEGRNDDISDDKKDSLANKLSSSSWGTFFHESLSRMMKSPSSSTLSSSSLSASAPHPSLRYPSHHDWN